MQDEPTNTEVVEEVVADEPQLAEPNQQTEQIEDAVQEEAPEVAEEVEEQTPAEEETTNEEPKENWSRRKQERYIQLLDKFGPPPAQVQQAPYQRNDALDYNQALDADPEVIKQLEADRKAAEQAQYNRGRDESNQALAYSQFYNNIRFDLPLVSEKLSKLDRQDAEALDLEYMKITGADPSRGYVQNPNIGYAEFIEARIEQAERLAASMAATTTKNIVKQAAQTGLRPDGSSSKRLNLNQAPENMSIEELYAVMGQKPPKQ